jgi:hypothetical protein
MGLKYFLKKNMIIGIAIVSIVISTTVVAVAVQGNTSVTKVKNTTPVNAKMSKEDAVGLTKEYLTKIFKTDLAIVTQTIFFEGTKDAVGSWVIRGETKEKKYVNCVIDPISKKVNNIFCDAKPELKKTDTSELSNEDIKKTKELLHNAINDKKYADTAKNIMKDVYGNETITSVKSCGSMIKKSVSFSIDENGKEDFSDISEDYYSMGGVDGMVNIIVSGSKSVYHFTFRIDTGELQNVGISPK